MGEENSGGHAAGVELNAVKIDTTLGTHLLTMLPVSFSVLEAKRKIESDHLEAFGRDKGEMRIEQLKVKHMGDLYCLSDDTILDDAFTTGSTISSRFKSVLVEASSTVAGALHNQESEGNISAANEASFVSEDTRKNKNTNKRSHGSAAYIMRSPSDQLKSTT